MKKIILVLSLLLIFLAGCTTSTYKNVDAVEFNKLISQKDVFVIDVHTPEQEHIKGTDAVIPYNEIENYIDSLPEDKNTKIAIYCRSGSMSVESSQKLMDLGYNNIYNLEGGRNAYIAEFN